MPNVEQCLVGDHRVFVVRDEATARRPLRARPVRGMAYGALRDDPEDVSMPVLTGTVTRFSSNEKTRSVGDGRVTRWAADGSGRTWSAERSRGSFGAG